MRTENSIRNSAFALGGQFVSLLTGFIMRTVFVHTLGDDYLGPVSYTHLDVYKRQLQSLLLEGL